MTWNYRIIKYRDNSGFGLHEVFYDDEGEPWTMTECAVGFGSTLEDGEGDIINALQMALEDAKERPVLDEPEEWPGKAPEVT